MSKAELTADEVVRLGGWSAAYAVVPTIATDGNAGVALVASNGLGFEIEVEVFVREAGVWRSSFSFGFGSGDGGPTTGAEPGCVFAVGKSPQPAAPVLVQYADEVFEVVAGTNGYWSWIKAVDEPWRHGAPEVVQPD